MFFSNILLLQENRLILNLFLKYQLENSNMKIFKDLKSMCKILQTDVYNNETCVRNRLGLSY